MLQPFGASGTNIRLQNGEIEFSAAFEVRHIDADMVNQSALMVVHDFDHISGVLLLKTPVRINKVSLCDKETKHESRKPQ